LLLLPLYHLPFKGVCPSIVKITLVQLAPGELTRIRFSCGSTGLENVEEQCPPTEFIILRISQSISEFPEHILKVSLRVALQAEQEEYCFEDAHQLPIEVARVTPNVFDENQPVKPKI
jgi:hypothetical protein